MERLRTNFLVLVLCLSAQVQVSAQSPFALVFIDGNTERQYGEFPLDRAVVARGIDQIKSLKAKAIVLKFFLDLPKKAEADAALAKSFEALPVLLQARMDDSEKNPNPLASRFFLNIRPGADDNSLSGDSGWIPLEILAAKAADVGFVDFRTPTKVPILEKYRGRFVKSLYLCAMESALGAEARISPGKDATISGTVIRLDAENQTPVQLPAKDELKYIAFHDLLSDKVAAEALEGKVVILGYDGPKIESVSTPRGQIRSHRLFFYQLESLYRNAIGITLN